MTVTDIIALSNAGYNHEQIMQLAQAQQMERAQQTQQPAQQAQQMERAQQAQHTARQAQQPAQQAQQTQQMQQPGGYEQIMSELLGLKQAVQAANMMVAQQPAQTQTAEDIIANIIAPKPRKETK